MHIHTKYKHIHHIHTYTCIYIHIHTYTNYHAVDAMHVYWKQQYTCRYMQIHAYTYIYLFPTYIFSEYVYFLFIRTYTAYTCIYMQCEKWCFCTGSQKKCTYIACILTYLYVYDSVFCMYFVCIHVFCMYIAVSMRLATFRTENTLIYVYTVIYMQYTTRIRTIYDTIYCNIHTK